MRNLYRKVGLGDIAPRAAVTRAAARAAGLKLDISDVQFVLLDERRKRVYDRNYRVLATIGILRSQLDLTQTSSWQINGCREFDAASNQERRNSRTASNQRSDTKPAQDTISPAVGHPYKLYWAVGVPLLIWIVSWFQYFSKSDKQTANAPNTSRSTAPHRVAKPDISRVPTVPVGASQPKPVFVKPSLPLPSNGACWMNSTEPAVAPFKVTTPIGGGHHLVKLVKAYTGEEILTLFVHEGRSAEVKVPLGTYRMRYLSGDMWYGHTDKFGPQTRAFRADDVFEFRRETNGYGGVAVELIKQLDGNLSTEEMPVEAF